MGNRDLLRLVLANLNRTAVSLSAALDDDNRAHLKQTLAATAELTQALAAQKQTLSAGIADAARTASSTAQASERLSPLLARIASAADAVEKAGVLFTTGYTANAIVHHGVLDPGTNFLAKPFGIDQLAQKVRAVLDGR